MLSKYLINSIFCLSFLGVCFSKSFKENLEIPKRECPYPVLKQNGSETAVDVVGFLNGIAEVRFDGAFGKTESKRHCKIKCTNGQWVGPLCMIEGGSETSNGYYPVLRSCSSQIFHSKFIVSHRNKTILVRCKNFGVYKLKGDPHLTCQNGVWKYRMPSCVPTTWITNFTDDTAPPSVLAKVISGSVSIEPTGEVAVYPGSTVHLECLYLRSSGEPEWSWTSTYRTYSTGWSINAEEREWKYRLSIYYTKPQDTGIYTCSTPKGLTHSIVLNVIEVHCDVSKVMTNDPNLLARVQGSRLGQFTTYQCREGFKLNGTTRVTCQASGVWSSQVPECTPVVCPSLESQNDTVKLIKQDLMYGGKAVFECPEGYKLIGISVLVCRGTGEWSGDLPTCEEAVCSPPLVPENVKLKKENGSDDFPFRVGSVVTFACKQSFKMVGEESIKCLRSGQWSNSPPLCEATCHPLSDPPWGTFGPRKARYEAGDRISLTCSKGYKPTSRIRAKCLKNGSWSDNRLECRTKTFYKSKTGKNSANTTSVRQTSDAIAVVSEPNVSPLADHEMTSVLPSEIIVQSTPRPHD